MMNKRNKILVTGAAGLIGGATIRLLNSLGHTDIIAVDKLGSCPYKWKNLNECKFAEFYELSYFEEHMFGSVADQVENIIHLGARSHTTEKDMAFLVENNYHFTTKLAELSNELKARFVYASSAATYGASKEMFDESDFDFISNLKPLNPYGYSKYLVDTWMAKNCWCNKRAIGLKYFNVFGPNERHKDKQQSVVLKGFDELETSGTITLFDSANPSIPTSEMKRDFLYVKDAAKVAVWATIDPYARNNCFGLFNVGSGIQESFVNLARYTIESYARQTKSMRELIIRYVPMPVNMRDKYQYNTVADISKLRAAGYNEPFTSLKDSVDDYIVNHLSKEL